MFQVFRKNMQRLASNVANRVSNKKRSQKARPRHAGCSIQVESLEKRQMMAVASLQFVGTRLVVTADDFATNVRVEQTDSKINIRDISTNRQWDYPVSRVGQVEFRGGNGNDTFINFARNLPVRAFGGRGNDYLEGYQGNDVLVGGQGDDEIRGYGGQDVIRGGKGNDTLYGMDGHDTLKGQSGADVLYGGDGDDTLYGGAGRDELFGNDGNDGLFGGVGESDRLNGGAGEDRFLVNSVVKRQKYYKNWWDQARGHRSYRNVTELEDRVEDRTAGDSVTHFRNLGRTSVNLLGGGDVTYEGGVWNDADIERVDKALRNLHRLTGNTRLLKLSSGRDLVFERVGRKVSGNGDWGGWTSGDGHIVLTANANSRLHMTTYHEIAHNWDDPHENNRIQAFRQISGWQNQGGRDFVKAHDNQSNWFYRSNTANEFARDYGRSNPMEDFATTWESYFDRRFHGNQSRASLNYSAAKHAVLDGFFASLRT
jgi:hypothetical protein